MSKFLQFLMLTVFVSTVSMAQVEHIPLVEEWTQASCGPCAQQNPKLNALLDVNEGKVVAIKYQTYFPGNDPMNEQNPAEVEVRRGFYPGKVLGVPTMVMGGTLWPTGPQAYDGAPWNLTQQMIDDENAKMSPIDVIVSHEFNDDFDEISVSVTVKNADTKTFQGSKNNVYIAIVERNINFAVAPGTNGETAFFDVMRKMIPNAAGTKLKSFISKGKEEVIDFTMPLPSYLYNAKEIAVVAWVQNTSTKDVIQAGRSEPVDVEKYNLPDVAVENDEVTTNGYCDHEFTPELTVHNTGGTDLTGIVVAYSLDRGQNYTTKTLDEELKSGDSYKYTFDAVELGAGNKTVVYAVQKPAAITQREVDQLNNVSLTPTITLFEKDAWTEEAEFTMENSANFALPNHIIGELFSPLIIATVDKSVIRGSTQNFGGYERSNKSFLFWFRGITRNSSGQVNIQKMNFVQAAQVEMSFDWAMSNGPNNSPNKVEIIASTDCGMTWNTVWEKQGDDLATAPVSTDPQAFYTPRKAHWVSHKFNLGDLAGEEEVVIRIKLTSAGDGNAVGYMDNIKIERTITVDNEDVTVNDNAVVLSPNPVADMLNIDMSLSTQSDVNVTIHHMNGQLIDRVMNNENMTSGDHVIQWNTVNALPGQYMVKVATATETLVKKFVIIH